jgi:acyl carrier protein
MSNEVLDINAITQALVDHLQSSMGVSKSTHIPLDESLLAAGIIDSFAIIELAEFIESKWKIKIEDSEFIGMNFGSLHKMAAFILSKKVI